MRCIDADILVKRIKNKPVIGELTGYAYRAEIIAEIEYAQTIEPEPQIVRCKDCAKREYCRTSNTWAVAPNDDWFCADAERKSDG